MTKSEDHLRNSVKITVYRWAGKKWFLEIHGDCIECDLALSQVRTLVARNAQWPIELEVKPWLSHVWESLRHGGWHAPVILVDRKLVRQGTIPTVAELQAAVLRAFEARGVVTGTARKRVGRHEEEREKACCGAARQ